MSTQGQTRAFKNIKHCGPRPKNDQDNHFREKLCTLVRGAGCFFEIYPEKLYLICLSRTLEAQTSTAFCLKQRNDPKSPFILWPFMCGPGFVYEPFNMDFGPFNLATTHLFCSKIKVWLDTHNLRDPDKCVAVVLDDMSVEKKLNATLALAIAAMVLLGLTDQEVIQRLSFFMIHKGKPSDTLQELTFRERKKFSDVSGNQSALNLTLEDCIKAFYAALQMKFYDYYDFDHGEYLFYETVMSGDLNWIVPNKILAFAGPSDGPNQNMFYHKHPPRFYYHYFKDHNVTTIIRLNDPEYDSAGFTELGFDHHDLIFPDGYPPTSTIAAKFIKLVDEAKGAVAVHCYAGIGRTGTLIAAYLMTRYNFTAQMAIGWTRICRPGSVIGDQQDWLYTKFDPYSIDRNKPKANKTKKTKPNILLDQDDDLDVKQTTKTSYAIAEKTYGQARALLLTKKRREKVDTTNTRPETRSSTVSKKSSDDGDVIVTRDSQSNSRQLDIILDLGKTVPLGLIDTDDIESLKSGCRNPDIYIIKDGRYEWKVKFPQPSYIKFKYDFKTYMSSVMAITNNEEMDLSSRESMFDFKFELDETIEQTVNNQKCVKLQVPKLIPTVYFSPFSVWF